MRDKQCMTAVLLAGGKSSRMGYHPKQQLMIDGESFQTRILKQLQGFGEIAISRRNENEENAEDIPYPRWQDQIPDLGPLGGIFSCLQRAAYEAVFFVACDYPMMTTECMDFLIGQMQEEDDCVIPVVNGRIHPVCAVYRKRICPVLEEQINNGELAVKKLLKRLQVHDVEMPEAYERCFRNVNTPEEYEKIKSEESKII